MPDPRITFIGAGSTVFMKNIVGDVLQRPALAGATIALMDINPERLEESAVIAGKLIATLGVSAKVETYSDQRAALDGADFVVVCFQIGGYDPCTITDFEDLCRRIGIAIRERLVLHEGKPVTALPNLLGSLAVYRCTAA